MLTTLIALSLSLVPQEGGPPPAPNTPPEIDSIRKRGLVDLGAFNLLSELCTKIGGRLSGSPEAARAVAWTKSKMESYGFQNVRLVPCMVPHWVRGSHESASLITPSRRITLNLCALGGSVGTPSKGLTANVIEVHSLAEAEKLGAKARGKIIFYNRPFDETLPTTFEMYGKANDQRTNGAISAAKVGAIGVLVRSMTSAKDDNPHTGAMHYDDKLKKIPAAALGIQSAERLSAALKRGPVKVNFRLNCKTLPDVPSASVIGEITGSTLPNEVIVIGGHLDSWDLAQGAHDDGAGVTQSIEAVRLLKVQGLQPKRTIRAIAFMNEENGLRGGNAYAVFAKDSGQRHLAAMESDAGGFMPRSFGVPGDRLNDMNDWLPYLRQFGIERFNAGGGGADIGPLAALGTEMVGLQPDGQRYFDYHHAANDTIDKVNPRELEMGAMAMAALAWQMSDPDRYAWVDRPKPEPRRNP